MISKCLEINILNRVHTSEYAALTCNTSKISLSHRTNETPSNHYFSPPPSKQTKNPPYSLSLFSPPPKRPRPPQPRSNNLPLPCANTSKSVLIVTTHVPILIHIPTLASSCARIGILGRLLQRALTLLPLLLSLPLALHFTLEERFTRPSRVLSLLLRGGAT